jgi:hypothetical protein
MKQINYQLRGAAIKVFEQSADASLTLISAGEIGSTSHMSSAALNNRSAGVPDSVPKLIDA